MNNIVLNILLFWSFLSRGQEGDQSPMNVIKLFHFHFLLLQLIRTSIRPKFTCLKKLKESDDNEDENNQTENASYIIIMSAKGLQQGTHVGK